MLGQNETHSSFIKRTTKVLAPPIVPEMRLHLAEETISLWQESEEALGLQGLPPPFWAFAWAGGQALARYILDHPGVVRNKYVLDFAAGGGIAGIAAALAGASRVEATEIDDFAVASIRANATLNAVSIHAENLDIVGQDKRWDIVLAGDVFYEDTLSRRIQDWLAGLALRGAVVLIGDPGRHFLPRHRLEALAEYSAPMTRDLEDREIRNTKAWQFRP